MPKFSIIIPVYDVAPYLRECLDSVLAQTFTEWEAICVDDGSTDGSGAILDEFSAKDTRFRVIHQTNAGVSSARNVALDTVRGEWFLFLDGDDMFRPDALEHFILILKDEVCDAILMQPYVEWFPREDVGTTKPFRVLKRMSCGFHLMTDEISANGFPFGRVYRTKKFWGIRFQAGLSMCEDLLFWSMAVRVPAHWIAVEGSYYFYRQRNGSACKIYDFNRYSQIIDVITKVVASMASDVSGVEVVVKYWQRYRWSCEQIQDAFQLWEGFDSQQRQKLLSYQDSIRSVCPIVPFSFDFRLVFAMHKYHLHCLYKPTLLGIRVVRALKRRMRIFPKGR